jgi:hypothetical protein
MGRNRPAHIGEAVAVMTSENGSPVQDANAAIAPNSEATKPDAESSEIAGRPLHRDGIVLAVPFVTTYRNCSNCLSATKLEYAGGRLTHTMEEEPACPSLNRLAALMQRVYRVRELIVADPLARVALVSVQTDLLRVHKLIKRHRATCAHCKPNRRCEKIPRTKRCLLPTWFLSSASAYPALAHLHAFDVPSETGFTASHTDSQLYSDWRLSNATEIRVVRAYRCGTG